MGRRRIAEVARIPISEVVEILYGRYLDDPTNPEHRLPRKRVSRATSEKVIAVRADLAAHAVVDATVTIRRLQALVTLGWSVTALGRRLNLSCSNVHTLMGQGRVLEVKRRQVVALYDEMWAQRPGPSGAATRATRYAANRGWVSPLAWDDDTIDDPHASPQGVSAEATRVSLTEQVTELIALGYSVTEIPARVGMPSLSAVANRIRNPELKAELSRRAA